ncbi:MAG: hypothetical protein ABEJ31_09110 [Haloarculaceae archaeon]
MGNTGGDRDGALARRGVTVDEALEDYGNSLCVDEETAAERLVACHRDPERSLVDVPDESDFAFAKHLSRRFEDRF